MILDTLGNAAKYAELKRGLSEAFGFLDQPGLAELPDGRYEIMGKRVYALISHDPGRRVADAQLEAHRRYIDIQYVISGCESMGWSPMGLLKSSVPYDAGRDLEFFEDIPESIVKVPAGCFALFLPSDAHLPLIGEEIIHKVVIKIAVD